MKAASAGMTVVFCVGETLEERTAGKVDEVNFAQLAPLKESLPVEQWS